jgi:hypothetical protein
MRCHLRVEEILFDRKPRGYMRCRLKVQLSASDSGPPGLQVNRERIWYRALQPEGGASDVGESILHYVRQNKVNLRQIPWVVI